MLSPIKANYINPTLNTSPLTFKQSKNQMFNSEKKFNSVEIFARRTANVVSNIVHRNNKQAPIFNELLRFPENTKEYFRMMRGVSKLFANPKEVEINIESNRINDIVTSDTPRIFIMNHDNQKKDPKMFAFFNTLLSNEYIEQGKAETCPRPRFILNENILIAMNKRDREIYKKLGAVGIDANINSADSKANAKTFLALLRDFINDKINIFIFPEGKKSRKKSLPLAEKFQLGVAEIVAKIADKVPKVIVTPLGFAFGKKNEADGIYIGEDVVFKKEGEYITSSIGNIESPFAKDNYKRFFGNKKEAIITENSIPVKGKELSKFIGGILCENLRICKEEAIHSLQKGIKA